MTCPIVVNFTEIAGSEQPDTFGKSVFGRMRYRGVPERLGGELHFRANGQLLAANGAAT